MKALYTTFIIIPILMLPLLLRCSGDSGDYFDALTSSVTAPDSIPQSLKFTDSDPDEDQLAGDLVIEKAADESKITTYRLYWGSGESTRLSGEGAISSFAADGSDHTHTFAADTAVPSGATHLLVYTEGDEGEVTTPTAIDFADLVIRRVRDINSTGSSTPTGFTVYSNELYFSATDGVDGLEVWKTNGTEAGTVQVHNINTDTASSSSSPSYFTVFDSKLYFSATNSDTTNRELWESDGTAATSYELNAGANSGTGHLAVYNGKLFFSAEYNTGLQLWSFNNPSFTPMTSSPATGIFPMYLIEYDGKLYFAADNGTDGVELWESDGTGAGTNMVLSGLNASGDSSPHNLIVYNGKLYFAATNGTTTGVELYSYDGSSFQLLNNIHTAASSYPSNPIVFNYRLYFQADNGSDGAELWRSDGSGTGTVLFADINPGSTGSSPASMCVYNGRLYFSANDGTHGEELWVTDGTTAGTKLVCDVVPGINSFSPSGLTVYNNRMYFSATDASSDTELWVLYYK